VTFHAATGAPGQKGASHVCTQNRSADVHITEFKTLNGLIADNVNKRCILVNVPAIEMADGKTRLTSLTVARFYCARHSREPCTRAQQKLINTNLVGIVCYVAGASAVFMMKVGEYCDAPVRRT
jgi:hypothetical protein